LLTFNRTPLGADSPFLHDFSFYQSLHAAGTPTGSMGHFLVNNYWPNGGDDAKNW
jgi:hypothetical protein